MKLKWNSLISFFNGLSFLSGQFISHSILISFGFIPTNSIQANQTAMESNFISHSVQFHFSLILIIHSLRAAVIKPNNNLQIIQSLFLSSALSCFSLGNIDMPSGFITFHFIHCGSYLLKSILGHYNSVVGY